MAASPIMPSSTHILATPRPHSPWTPTSFASTSTIKRKLPRSPRVFALVIGPDSYLYDSKDEAMERVRERGFGYLEKFKTAPEAQEWADSLTQMWDPHPLGWSFSWRDEEESMRARVRKEKALEEAAKERLDAQRRARELERERKRARTMLEPRSTTGSPAVSAVLVRPAAAGSPSISTLKPPDKAAAGSPRLAVGALGLHGEATATATATPSSVTRPAALGSSSLTSTQPNPSPKTAKSTVVPPPSTTDQAGPSPDSATAHTTTLSPSQPVRTVTFFPPVSLPGSSAQTSIAIDDSPEALKKPIDLTWLESSDDEH